MIKLKLFQSEWEGLYNTPIQYFLQASKNYTIVNKDRLTKACYHVLPALEKKCFQGKNKGGAKIVHFEYFEAFVFLEMLKTYPINAQHEWMYTTINMVINMLDNQL